jgi:hypothetical protein
VTEQTERADRCRAPGVLRAIVLQLGAPIDAGTVDMRQDLGRPGG